MIAGGGGGGQDLSGCVACTVPSDHSPTGSPWGPLGRVGASKPLALVLFDHNSPQYLSDAEATGPAPNLVLAPFLAVLAVRSAMAAPSPTPCVSSALPTHSDPVGQQFL